MTPRCRWCKKFIRKDNTDGRCPRCQHVEVAMARIMRNALDLKDEPYLA